MRYLFSIVVVSIAVLAGITGLRFGFSHRLGPDQTGLHGVGANAPVDILFIGSSHTRLSYDARLIEQKTGKRVFLLAYSGLDPVTIAPIVGHVLDGPNRPKLLVVEAYGAIWGRPHQVQDTRVFFEAEPVLKTMLLERLLRPKTLDAHLDAFALLVNRSNEQIVGYPVNRALLGGFSYHGAYADRELPGLTPQQFARLWIPMSGDLHIDPEERAALLEIIRLAQERGVPLVFAESPLPHPISNLPVILGLKRDVRAFMAETGVPYFDGEEGFPLTDPSLFADANHVSTKGRVLYSERTAEWLNRVMKEGK